MACPTIKERYDRLKREADAERVCGRARRASIVKVAPPVTTRRPDATPRTLPSLARASRFPAMSRVRYNAEAHSHWRAHEMIGTVLGFHFKPEYKDKRIHLEADWLIRVEWDGDIGHHTVHPDWLEIVHKQSKHRHGWADIVHRTEQKLGGRPWICSSASISRN